jgi:DNA-binding response OmpR family regulator
MTIPMSRPPDGRHGNPPVLPVDVSEPTHASAPPELIPTTRERNLNILSTLMRDLMVEDDPALVLLLERGLTAYSHQCLSADNGENGAWLAADEAVELVRLDILLPRLDAHRVLQRVRLRRPEVPVLMLTARDDVRKKVHALDAGADDYLAKPFDLEELPARMRALTRRADQPPSSTIEAGNLKVDLCSRRV